MMSQVGLLKEFFSERPNQDIPVHEAVDWAQAEWGRTTGTRFRHPGSILRSLYQSNYLTKPKRGYGYYRYEPDISCSKTSPMKQLSSQRKADIRARDNNQCAFCGNGPREGESIYVVNLPDQVAGDDAQREGITLCGKHKNLFIASKSKHPLYRSQFFFINTYQQAKQQSDAHTANFCQDILAVYQKHNI